jgi:hypothetical protein
VYNSHLLYSFFLIFLTGRAFHKRALFAKGSRNTTYLEIISYCQDALNLPNGPPAQAGFCLRGKLVLSYNQEQNPCHGGKRDRQLPDERHKTNQVRLPVTHAFDRVEILAPCIDSIKHEKRIQQREKQVKYNHENTTDSCCCGVAFSHFQTLFLLSELFVT